MADIRCPMCGKLNPADRVTCQYCQARLTPLIAGAPAEPPTPPSQPPPKPSQPSTPSEGDWLSDFRSEEPMEAGAEEAEAPGGSAEFGDWFSRLEEPVAAEPEKPAGKPLQPEEEALPDWLGGLREETPTPSPEPEGGMDWLKEFQTPSPEEPAPAPEKEEKAPASSAEPEAGMDWLKEFQTPSPEEPTPAPEKEEEAPAPSAEPEGGMDWLKEFQTPSPEEPAPAPEKPEEGGPMDWLAGLGALAEPGAEEAGPGEAAGELPDWMKPAEEPGPFQKAGPSQQTPVPDWLREVGGEPAAGEPAEPGVGEPVEPAVLGEIPDWLKSQAPSAPQEEKPPLFTETGAEQEIGWPQAETPATPPTEAPEWPSEGTPPPEQAVTGEAETPARPAPEEELPADWFSKLGITSGETPTGATPAFVMSDEDLSPFVSGDELSAAEPLSGDMESLPDWLSQMPTEQPAPPPEAPRAAPPPAPEAQAEPELAPAQLPTWLEAMRPIESAAPTVPAAEEGPSTMETAGPLAGLRGILPAEAEIARIRKPPVYSVKLQVSEAHQARVSLLEELVATEGKPKPVAPHIAVLPQTALRLAIAVVLFLAVFGALWLGTDWTALPDPQSVPQELDDLRGQIESLSANASVLVAFDYDPGFTGEMEAASSAVLSHLIEKRVPLTFVSTNLLGPALADRLVKRQVDELNSQFLSNTSPYTTSLFANLGYIPGGIAGLRAFAQTPADIFPRSLDGQDIWSSPPLTPTMTLAGFTMALVITDNPDTARAWIEQAAPTLKPSPLLMVLSAQAEPIIRPYYDSGQVQGMSAGLAGGAAYENKRGRSGLASQYWDAFSLSLLVATILILIGGLVNASLASMTGKKQKGEEQPYA